MAMTVTEKILARAAGRRGVSPGEAVWAGADLLLSHDVCGPGTIGVFRREFGRGAKVFDREKVVLLPDHYIFTKDEKARRNVSILRAFAKEQALPYFYDPGTPAYRGVCHVALPELGHARPGMVIFGTDSHTCTHGALGAFATGIGNTDAGFVLGAGKLLVKVPPTIRIVLDGEMPARLSAKDLILRVIGDIGADGASYCALEFAGEAVAAMGMDERFTLCNMAVEAGAKNGIIEPDAVSAGYAAARSDKPFEPVTGDPGAKVLRELRYDVSALEPLVAKPPLPSNAAPAARCAGIRVDRVYIGSCTGGKLADFAMAAEVLRGRRVSVPTLLVPATRLVDRALDRETIGGKTLREIFLEAGAGPFAPPSCAACLGGPPDTFGRAVGNETIVSTTNRNFIGRMGSKDASIYLASPYTAAASAVRGFIADPRGV